MGQARQDNEYHIKKRKLRGGAGPEETNASNSGIIRQAGEPPTDIEKHLNIRKQIEQRRKNLFPVQPKPPQGFKDYLMNKKTYHLQGNTGKDSRIQPIPKIAPPPSLEGPVPPTGGRQVQAAHEPPGGEGEAGAERGARDPSGSRTSSSSSCQPAASLQRLHLHERRECLHPDRPLPGGEEQGHQEQIQWKTLPLMVARRG